MEASAGEHFEGGVATSARSDSDGVGTCRASVRRIEQRAMTRMLAGVVLTQREWRPPARSPTVPVPWTTTAVRKEARNREALRRPMAVGGRGVALTPRANYCTLNLCCIRTHFVHVRILSPGRVMSQRQLHGSPHIHTAIPQGGTQSAGRGHRKSRRVASAQAALA